MKRRRNPRLARLFHYKPSLRTRLVGLMLFTSMSLIAILILFYQQTEKALFNEFGRRTTELSRAVQIGLEGATGKNLPDIKSLEKYLSTLNPKGIKEISVISSSDRIVASTNRDNVGKWITERRRQLIFKAGLGDPVTGEGQNYNVVIPVVSGQNTVGYIHMSLNVEDFSVFLRLGTIRRVIAALVILMFGLVVTVALASMYTRPIEQIAAVAGKVAAGDLSQQLPVKRQDEIGILSRSFNHMIARLREDRDLRERLRTAEHLAGMGQFAKSVAHEIKNPLNFISLSIDHLSEAYRPDDTDKAERLESMVRNIKGEIQRISRFVESYLELGKPFDLHRRLTPMAEIVDSVLELVEARAEQARIRIVREYGALPELSVDPELIRTCLYNIVINAFDAMPEGGALTVRAEYSSTRLSLAFADTGIGVGQEQIDKVFEPYFTTKNTGFGLGLALTRKIIEEHGGKVLFSSRPGAGSVVTMQFPLNGEARG